MILLILQRASVITVPVLSGAVVAEPLALVEEASSLKPEDRGLDVVNHCQGHNVLLSRGQLSSLSLNKRIIIVDDLHLSANTLKSRLEKHFTKENGCFVEIETSPEAAVRKIKAAKDSGYPYDVLVTDLFMQTFEGDKPVGINGDEMLRQLASEKCFLPTVIYSGSWSNGIEINFSDQLDQIKTELELQLIMGDKTVHPDIPIIHITKNGITDADDFFQKSLMYLGQKKDDEKLELISQYVKDFKPDLYETTLNSFFLCRVVEGVGLFIQKTAELNKSVQEIETSTFNPPQLYNRSKDLISKFLNQMREFNFSYSELSSQPIAKTRKKLHDFAGLVGGVMGHARMFSRTNPDLKMQINELDDIYHLIKAYMKSSKEAEKNAYDLVDLVNWMRVSFKDEKLILPSNRGEDFGEIKVFTIPELLMEFLEHPVSNALKAVKDKSDGLVNIYVNKVNLDQMLTRYQEKFSTEDKIVEVLIEDNGCGIDSERLERINSKKAISGDSTFGTLGWGMAYMQENIDSLGGAYYVESEVGKGTKFRLFFKIDESIKAE